MFGTKIAMGENHNSPHVTLSDGEGSRVALSFPNADCESHRRSRISASKFPFLISVFTYSATSILELLSLSYFSVS